MGVVDVERSEMLVNVKLGTVVVVVIVVAANALCVKPIAAIIAMAVDEAMVFLKPISLPPMIQSFSPESEKHRTFVASNDCVFQNVKVFFNYVNDWDVMDGVLRVLSRILS